MARADNDGWDLASSVGATATMVAAARAVATVSVSDDGVGGADPSRGSGLVGLRDRVDTLGGTLTLSSPPSGTSLVVQLPMTSD